MKIEHNVYVISHILILNCREDEVDDSDTLPIVRENAGKLVENGINTIQKTLLLKKHVEVYIYTFYM